MIRNLTGNYLIAEKEHFSVKFFERLQGMIGKDFSKDMDCMIFPFCNSIHMFFMARELDVIFLDRENRIVKTLTAKPWRIYSGGRRTVKVLELPPGTFRKTPCAPGDKLELDADR